RALLKAVPEIGAGHERLLAIPGTAPQPGEWPAGCRFHPRCPQRQSDCDAKAPGLEETTKERSARCMYWELTPPVEERDVVSDKW
ncbi:MAG: oligopeptide/dipeptide ABC transporter ATP-binding protein, partial [Limisphaerales bacterium]